MKLQKILTLGVATTAMFALSQFAIAQSQDLQNSPQGGGGSAPHGIAAQGGSDDAILRRAIGEACEIGREPVADGRDISRLKPHQVARRGIGRTFQNIRLFGYMSALDNVRVAQDSRLHAHLWSAMFKTPFERSEERRVRERAQSGIDETGRAFMDPDEAVAEARGTAFETWLSAQRFNSDQLRLLHLVKEQVKANAAELTSFESWRFDLPPLSMNGGFERARAVFGGEAELERVLGDMNRAVFEAGSSGTSEDKARRPETPSN